MTDYNLQCVEKRGGSMAVAISLNNNNATQKKKKKIDGQ
jgi:hypothetical protein